MWGKDGFVSGLLRGQQPTGPLVNSALTPTRTSITLWVWPLPLLQNMAASRLYWVPLLKRKVMEGKTSWHFRPRKLKITFYLYLFLIVCDLPCLRGILDFPLLCSLLVATMLFLSIWPGSSLLFYWVTSWNSVLFTSLFRTGLFFSFLIHFPRAPYSHPRGSSMYFHIQKCMIAEGILLVSVRIMCNSIWL